MSIKKKIISCAAALALAATSAVSFTGCADVSYALVIDGEKIPAGVYILYSGYAQSDAQSKLTEEQPDLDTSAEGFDYYAQTVSGMSFGEYVEQQTQKYCKEYVAVNRLYDELGIVSDPVEQETVSDNINDQWNFSVSDWTSMLSYLKGYSTLGDYYQSFGVAKSSFKEVMNNGYKKNEIFDYYYGEGGVEEVPKDEITEYVGENYSLTRYFSISLTNDEGDVIEDEDELKVLEELANGYVDDLNGGASFSEVYEKYQKYIGDGDEEDEEEHDHEDSDYDRIITKTATSPSKEFVEALFKQDTGTAALFKADTSYYVGQRLDITENEEYVEDYTDTALDELRGDDLDGVIEGRYSGFSVTENSNAPDYAREQATNARQALSAINTIQYYSYYSSLFSY